MRNAEERNERKRKKKKKKKKKEKVFSGRRDSCDRC